MHGWSGSGIWCTWYNVRSSWPDICLFSPKSWTAAQELEERVIYYSMWVLFGPFDGEIAGDTGFQSVSFCFDSVISILTFKKNPNSWNPTHPILLVEKTEHYFSTTKRSPMTIVILSLDLMLLEMSWVVQLVGLIPLYITRWLQSNLAVRPSLNIVNWSKKDKNILISRSGKELQAYPSSHEPLQDEDMVTLISGVHVTYVALANSRHLSFTLQV